MVAIIVRLSASIRVSARVISVWISDRVQGILEVVICITYGSNLCYLQGIC